MKKTLTILTSILCLGGGAALGQDDERFHKGQWDISPFATYVDKAGDDWGAGAAITYFLSERFGVGAATYWTDFEGTFFDNVSGEGYFRLPLLKVVAPYGVASGGYEFQTEEFIATLGAGIDFRPFKNLAAFSDVQWRFANDTKDGIFVRFGARFSF